MKFRYYITDLFDGVIKGTNDTDIANNYAGSEDFFVVDSENGLLLQTDGDNAEIEETKE